MNRSPSPNRGSSRRQSQPSRSPQRSRKTDSGSRRSGSPLREKSSDRRRSRSPRDKRRSSDAPSDRRRAHRSDSSDDSRERGRSSRHSSDNFGRSGGTRYSSPTRSSKSSHYDRRGDAAESRGEVSSRSRQSRWESEPVDAPTHAPAPVPAAAVGWGLPQAVALPLEKLPQPTVPVAASAVAAVCDTVQAPVAFTPVPLQPAQMTRIYVGNVYRELSEPEIQTVFEAFGPVRSCKFIPNPENGVGKHKGFGFIEYVDPAAAASAVQAMNGFTLAVPQPSSSPCCLCRA